MHGVGTLELVFSEDLVPFLERTVYTPRAAGGGKVTAKFDGSFGALSARNAAVSLAWCLVDYHLWGLGHPAGNYEFAAERDPEVFHTLANLLDTPGEFVHIFEPPSGPLIEAGSKRPKCLLKLIFPPPYRGAAHLTIDRELLAPEDVLIKRGNALVPVEELRDFREAIHARYHATGQGKWARPARQTEHGSTGFPRTGKVNSPELLHQRPVSGHAPASAHEAANRRMSFLGDFELPTPILNDRFFSGPLDSTRCWLELGLAEKQATDAQWEHVSRRAETWLREHPDDLLLRATALWLALSRGSFRQMTEKVRQTAEWILAGEPEQRVEDRKYELAKMLPLLRPNGLLSEWHLEDNLDRAFFLRWMRMQGRSSQLGRLAATIKRLLEMRGGPGAAGLVAPLLDEPHVARALAKAADLALRYMPSQPGNNLLRVACLWIIGRRAQREQVDEVIEGVGRWLAKHPEETLVRVAWIWLAGSLSGRDQAGRVIEAVGNWLATAAQQDECLARSAWLWLVGERGSDARVDEAIGLLADWLEVHQADSFVRASYLLLLVKRRGSAEQIAAALGQTGRWLEAHTGDELMELALDYMNQRAPMGATLARNRQ